VPGWLRCLTPRPDADVRLVCFPHAGGTAAFFGPWQRHSPAGVEVQVVQYPGRADRIREMPIDDAASLAAQLADAVAMLADQPLAFFGHSMGGVLAYETARILSRHGLAPCHLMVSASPPPGHRDPDGKELSALDDERLVAALGRLGGSDARLLAMPELLELILPAVRADFRLVERYVQQPGPLLQCPLTAYSGSDDRIAPPELMAAWSTTTSGPFTTRTFAGGHFYLQEHATDVLADVSAVLQGTLSAIG
jgi:surfactin synthase thioesterase subunit